MAGPNDGSVQSAADAFEADLNAEQGIRTQDPAPRESRSKSMEMTDLFPQRPVTGEERAGGDDSTPDVVRQAREKARGPRDPEPDEDDDDDASRELVDDEGEGDEDLPADYEADDDEEGGAEQAGLDLNQIVRVNVDNRPVEVSLKEALEGYVRTETFHQRLNQLKTVADNMAQERAGVSNMRGYYAQMIEALKVQIAAFQPQEPDWDRLYRENPAEAALLERQWRTFRENLAKLDNEAKRVAAEQAAENQTRFNAWADAQRRQMVVDVPEWGRSQKAWERDRRSMTRTALAAGYSEQEVDELYDARAVRVLLKAAKYDRLMAKKPVPVRQQQGTMRPGAITGHRAAPNGLTRADRRLQKTGSLRDAARAFEIDLDREG